MYYHLPFSENTIRTVAYALFTHTGALIKVRDMAFDVSWQYHDRYSPGSRECQLHSLEEVRACQEMLDAHDDAACWI